MLDAQFYGLNPGGHHFTNVLLHMATAILLFLVLRQMTGAALAERIRSGDFRDSSAASGIGGVGSGAQGCAERAVFHADPCGVRALRAPSLVTARYALVILLFALGLMCKPMLVTLPFVLLLLDYWPLNRFDAGRDRRDNIFPHSATTDPGKTATARSGRRLERGHTFCSEGFSPDVRGHSSSVTHRQCPHRLCDLSAANVLARRSGGLISIYGSRYLGVRNGVVRSCWSAFRPAFFSCGVVAIS